MPLDPKNAFDASEGIDDWFVPGAPRSDTSFPDDWFVPTPNMGQRAPGPQPNVANPGIANPPAAPPDPFADYWSLIPASRAGAMAWQPPIFLPPDPFAPENIPASKWLTPLPIFLGDSPTFPPNSSTTSVWPPAPSQLAGAPSAAAPGGILGALAHLGSSSPGPGGLLGALAQLDSSSPGREALPKPPRRSQKADYRPQKSLRHDEQRSLRTRPPAQSLKVKRWRPSQHWRRALLNYCRRILIMHRLGWSWMG
jgi:hypothetical protein